MALWNPFGKKKNKTEQEASEAPASNEAELESPELTDDAPPTPEPVEASESSEPEKEEKKGGWFSGFKKAVKKTFEVLNTDVRDLVGKEGRVVDDEFLAELFAILIKTDMGAGPAGKIRDGIKAKYRARKLSMTDLVDSAKETVREIMAQEQATVSMAESGPTVIMVVGVNGSGKTTSIAKLTHKYRSEGKKVVLGAGDTFRAAAVQQLTIWAERLGAEIVTGKEGGDPASVAYKAVETAVNTDADICIVDTAGRLQTQTNLMDQLTKIRNVMNRVCETAPHEVLLVLDATAGQNAISQARGFSEAAGCTGIVLAKLDGSAKGGVAIPIRQEFDLPVKFIGLGETPDAFAEFNVDHYVNALLDFEG